MVASGLALVLAALWPAAEKADFPVEVVESGYPRRILQGSARRGLVVPFHLELRSTKDAPVEVLVEAEVRSSQGTPVRRFKRRVEVPPRTTLRTEMNLSPIAEGNGNEDGFAANPFSITLKAQGKVLPLAEGQWMSSFESDVDTPAVLIAGRKTADPRSLWGSTQFAIGDRSLSADAIDHLDPKHLPGAWMGYLSVDTLLLDGVDEDALDPRQSDAIRAWVWQGGRVIFAGDKTGAVTRGALFRGFFEEGALGEAQLEAVESPRDLKQVVLVEREKRVEVNAPAGTEEEPAPLVLLDPFQRSGEREIIDRSRTTPRRLYIESRFGSGRVGWLTPTSDSLERTGVTFRQRLWALLLSPRSSPFSVGAFFPTQRAFQATYPTVAKSLSRRIGVWLISVFVAAYLLVVGPGAYWVLRRRKKLHWIVWVEPLIVLVAVGIFASTAYLAQGLSSRSRVVSVVMHRRGEPFASQNLVAGIFSGREATVRVTAPNTDDLTGCGGRGTTLALHAAREFTVDGFVADGFPIAHWETALFATMRLLATEPSEGISFEARFGDPGAGGKELSGLRVTNRLKVPVRAAYLRVDGVWMETPALASGQEIELAPPWVTVDFSSAKSAERQEGQRDERRTIAALIDDLKNYCGDHFSVAVLERGEGEILFDPAPVLENRLDLWVEIQKP